MHKAVTGTEALENMEIVDKTIASAPKEWAKHLLKCDKSIPAPRPVNEETVRFDELEAVESDKDTPSAAPIMHQNAHNSHSDEFFDAPTQLVSAKKLTRKEQNRVDATGRAITTDNDEKLTAKLRDLMLEKGGFAQPF